MWLLALIAVSCGAVVLHLWWRRRHRALESRVWALEADLRELTAGHERTLAALSAQQQTLLDGMVEGVIVLDPAGRIQLANRAAQELAVGTTSMTGATILEAFRTHELAEVVRRVRADRQPRQTSVEWPGIAPRHIQVHAALIDSAAGAEPGVLLVLQDLTRLRQLENTRQEFVANVSHELRTPLSIIKGYVETLIDGAKDDPAVAARFLQIILKHADRLGYLIEDLLTISALESGRLAINRSEIDLQGVVARVLDDLEPRAVERGVALRSEVPSPIHAYADGERIQQVLFNLIDNAIKYGRSGGTVVVGAEAQGENGARVWVRDDGPGIPPEAVGRVFERFYRVDRARSREQGGTGLGLSIVKHIVQAHDGECWAESELGRGSTFYFTVRGHEVEASEPG